MPTLFQCRGYRIVIFSNDHGPPHVHVLNDGSATIAVGKGIDDLRVVRANGIPRRMHRVILEQIIEQREAILQAWNDIHGD
jgi:hypothetical protein